LDAPHIVMQDVLGRIEKGYIDRIAPAKRRQSRRRS
jgi:hypothetical protein